MPRPVVLKIVFVGINLDNTPSISYYKVCMHFLSQSLVSCDLQPIINLTIYKYSSSVVFVEGNIAVEVCSLLLLPLEMNYPTIILLLFSISFQPLNVEQYDMICNISNELRSYASDVRILTTYYCGE